MMDLTELNSLDQETFTISLSEIFEHSPCIPLKTWTHRPFATSKSLHAALSKTLEASSNEEKLTVIRAHPDLAGKLAVAGALTNYSTEEQQSAQLDQLTEDQFRRITNLNRRYKEKFEFPFIICVKDHTQTSIFENFEVRINNDSLQEMQEAIKQINRIAWHRLNGLLNT